MQTGLESHGFGQYSLFLETYRHHLELFYHLIALYFTVGGVIVGVLFKENVGPSLRRGLQGVVVGLSVITVVGTFLAFRWGLQLEAEVRTLEDALKLVHFPFRGPKHMLIVLGVAVALVGVGTLVSLLRGLAAPAPARGGTAPAGDVGAR